MAKWPYDLAFGGRLATWVFLDSVKDIKYGSQWDVLKHKQEIKMLQIGMEANVKVMAITKTDSSFHFKKNEQTIIQEDCSEVEWSQLLVVLLILAPYI